MLISQRLLDFRGDALQALAVKELRALGRR